MQYICIKNYVGPSIGGNVDIPVGAALECTGRFIKYQNKNVCVNTSENAHEYFMRNDDGNGVLRGELIAEIKAAEIPDKIFKDPICLAYRKDNQGDIWIWNHAFYNTDIESLTYIRDFITAE